MKLLIFKLTLIINLAVSGMLFLCCNTANAVKEHILFNFEYDHDLDEIYWQCHTLMSISDQHATNGKTSLMLEMYPSTYPGFDPELKVKNWSKYKALCFDIYNPDETERNITIRIDDKKGNTEYKDRYNQSYIIKKGINHIRIDMASLVTSGTGRKMDSSRIDKFLIFTSSPAEKILLFIDYIRLVAE